jgi:P4 family phage/plasmid primase-like protien
MREFGGPAVDPAFSYIQLEPRGKDPLRGSSWGDAPRALIADVQRWAGDGSNLGVRTGLASSLWVLDVDVDVETGEPTEEWTALLAENGLPRTFTVRTPSGGLHYYFRMPQGVEVRNDQGKVIAPGVDIRGTGGYVVAPGCFAEYDKHGKHFAGTYDVIDDSPIAATPNWIALLFRAREEAKAEKAQRVNAGAPAPKADEIDPSCDRLAREELNVLFAQVEALAALPEGASLEILGEQRGWERGAGFFTLACKIIEVARWPHTSVTVEQASQAWASRVPSKYAQHDWNSALDSAGPTWAWGEQQRNAIDLFAGVPSANAASVRRRDEPDIGGEARQRMTSSADDDALWVTHSNGTKSLDIAEAARRVLIDGSVLVDATGGLWVYRAGAYISDTRHVGRTLVRVLDRRWNPGHVANVEKYIRTTGDALDFNEVAHPHLINFRNGMVDWRTGSLLEHHSDYRSTFQINAEWDAAAECPLFSHYVDTMLDPEAAVLLWQVIGYSMLSGNPMQVFAFFEGPGGNGKGVVQRALIDLLGAGNVSSLSMSEIDGENRFKLSRMVGRAANISGETPKTYIGDSSNLKKVTGGDWVDVERKGIDGVQVRIHALPVFSVNEVPSLGDDSEGLFQRAIVIPFHRSSSEHPIPNFDEGAFRAELGGIARRGIEALRAVRFDRPTLRADGFTLGGTGERARRDFREQANAELDWVSNHLRTSDEHWMTPTELYRAYGGRGQRPTRKFMKSLRERFGDPVKAVPSSLADWPMTGTRPTVNNRANCYGVWVSEDRVDPVRELFGVREEAS